MNKEFNSQAKLMRQMTSEEAENFLLETSFEFLTKIRLLECRTWSKSSQKRLAHYFISVTQSPNKRVYRALLSKMSLKNFLRVVLENFYFHVRSLDLIVYNLKPLLYTENYISEKNSIDEFFNSIELISMYLKQNYDGKYPNFINAEESQKILKDILLVK